MTGSEGLPLNTFFEKLGKLISDDHLSFMRR